MSFNAIKGQDKPINILKRYIEQSHLEGGYLFVGPQGIGKKLVARTLAKTVNCLEASLDTSTRLSVNGERSRTIDTCDTCASCKRIDNNQHPDVHIIEAEGSEIKIEYIRQLQKEINFKPYEARVKVFIIDNAHNLTTEASNAILKILEEPPKNSLIILISDKQALLFKTIISRCKILKFTALRRLELEGILKKYYSLENNPAHFLAYFSEGRLGTALKFKDCDILREKNKVIDNLVFSQRNSFENLGLQNREEVAGYFNILATWFRDIYLIKVGMPHSEIINFDRRDELLRLMSEFSFSDLNEILNSISDSILSLEQNMNIKLVLHNFMAPLIRH